MSLTSHIERKTSLGRFLLDQVKMPTLPDFFDEKPIVTHSSNRWSLLGTAFDYLVRMSLAREKKIAFEPIIAGISIKKFLKQNEEKGVHMKNFLYCINSTKIAIDENNLKLMAQNSLSFARLDPYYRSSKWDENWLQKSTDSEDIEELIQLHELWVKSFILPKGKLLLNPSFKSSRLVGGADADLIANQSIIDWKVYNDPKRHLHENLAQMVGYSILSLLDGKPLSNCIIYFARHGKQFSIPFDRLMKMKPERAIEHFKKLSNNGLPPSHKILSMRNLIEKRRKEKLKKQVKAESRIKSLITTGVNEKMEEGKMILKTKFSIFKGIGAITESKIYSAGIKSWEEFIKSKEIDGISAKLHVSICKQIDEWSIALEKFDHKFFAKNLKKNKHWMIFSLFQEHVCYLDIETTGTMAGYHKTTIIGIYNGSSYYDLVRGKSLSKESLQDALKDCKLLVTYFGLCFDIPFLKKEFIGIDLEIPHFDLCFGGREVGLEGGLKSIEKQLSMSRDENISSVDGYEAVRLWYSYERGNKKALAKLRDYCKVDTVNLSKLAPIIIANLLAKEETN